MSDPVIVDRQEQCLVVTLNRPESLNAFTVEMHQQLMAALNSVENDPAIRGVILTGAGRAFCAGQDLQESQEAAGSSPDLGAVIERYYNPLVRRLQHLPVPVIGAINGVAAGAGASLAFACDIVIAAQSARFIQSFSKIGLVPDSGATWTLPRLVGSHRARALTMLGTPLDAATALNWGLVWEVVENDAVLDSAKAIIEKLSAFPPTGLALTKKALHAALTATLDEQLDLERDLQSQAGSSPDHLEGVRAFIEKRAPVFTTGNKTS